ncbi:MAG: ABC transporter permease subunit [Holophagales bacterium]|nr:ABC transporter permease subunit [Holophagales bacterium]
MSFRDIRLLYLHELRTALRERGILLNILVIPVFLYPGILWLLFSAVAFVGGQEERFLSRIALLGLPPSHEVLRLQLEGDDLVRLVERVENPEAALRAGDLDLLVRVEPHPGLAGNVAFELAWDRSRNRSATARSRFESALESHRQSWLEGRVAARGMALADWRRFQLELHNAASARDVGAFLLGLIAPTFMVVVIAVGCVYPAVDTLAGERERGTWETSMTLAVSRASLLVAKYLHVATLGALAGLLNLAAVTLTLPAILAPWIGPDDAQLAIPAPAQTLPLMLVAALLLSLFLAAAMMLLAAFARTFKEGQSMVGPFFFLMLLPPLLVMSPDLELTLGWALVPVANVALLFRQAIAGGVEAHLAVLVFLAQGVYVLLCLWLARTVSRSEELVAGGESRSLGRFLLGLLRQRHHAAALGGGSPPGGSPPGSSPPGGDS